MPSTTERETRRVIKRLRQEGWIENKGKGSHVVFRKDGVLVSVPTSKRVLRTGTYLSIAEKAGWL